ncbi:hypothetical protein D0T84_16080 [Dysgonomonas sp. 521]|uniref:hypothetical protein n=1 Tax=Dysgonomonas sp. 521 TaxID=2302932 RepID=UPI0013D8DD4E|nr:hypothetical protein [Dysgonomonas sp. 521]NDV96420.1 hypothetical protein [Dysgonomonas sp. 521]
MYSEYLKFVEEQFEKCFTEKGYLQEKPVKITSRIDSSVIFIGSSISPMKKYVLNQTIGDNGRYLIQNSIRTQALKNIQNSELSMFGSYFKSMGALVMYRDLEKLVLDVFDYLTKYLKIPFDDIRLRINSEDIDLIDSIKQLDRRVIREYNTFGDKYYKHKYGLDIEQIKGRNFNIGIRKKGTDLFLDIGNVIVIENDIEKIAVEVALGNCTLSMCYFGVNSTIAGSRMADIFKIDTVEKMKFADAIIVGAILMYENIKTIKHPRWFIYNFRKYCVAIKFWKEKLNLEYNVIAEYMKLFLLLEYNVDIKLSNEEIINYIKVLNS